MCVTGQLGTRLKFWFDLIYLSILLLLFFYLFIYFFFFLIKFKLSSA